MLYTPAHVRTVTARTSGFDDAEHDSLKCVRPVLLAVEGVELHHEEGAEFMKQLDDDEKPGQRCHL